jgi:hypothetical protein
MKIPLLRPLALAAALLVAPSAAEAAFLPAFTGHGEFFNPNDGADGVVNFAVLENTDGILNAADFGGNAAFFAALTTGQSYGNLAALTSSRYIYLYQVANSDQGNTAPETELRIDRLLLGTSINLVTAGGTASGFVFNDNTAGSTGPVNTANALGTGISPDAGVNGVPGQSGVVAPSFVVDASAVGAVFEPSGVSVRPGPITGFGFRFNDPELASGNYSTILFIASNSTPAYMPGNLSNGSDFSAGDTPLPTPEPGTMALLALGLPVIGVRCIRRFRRGAAEAAA